MPKLFHLGKPFTPPTINGYAFTEGENNVWSADVREEDFHKFLIGDPGSPFLTADPNAPAAPSVPPPAPAPAAPEASSVPPAPAAPVTDAQVPPAPVPDAPPAPSGSPDAPPAGDSSPNGADTPGPGGDGGEGGPSDIAALPELAEYNALTSKGAIATKAAKELGLSLDPNALKRDELLAAVLGALREKKALSNQQ